MAHRPRMRWKKRRTDLYELPTVIELAGLEQTAGSRQGRERGSEYTLGKRWSTRMSSGPPWLLRYGRNESAKLRVWAWSSVGTGLYGVVGVFGEEGDARAAVKPCCSCAGVAVLTSSRHRQCARQKLLQRQRYLSSACSGEVWRMANRYLLKEV